MRSLRAFVIGILAVACVSTAADPVQWRWVGEGDRPEERVFYRDQAICEGRFNFFTVIIAAPSLYKQCMAGYGWLRDRPDGERRRTKGAIKR